MAGKFVITKDRRGEFRFKLVAANGQTIAVSQGYTTKAACVNGVESVRKHAAEATLDEAALVSTPV